MNQKIPKDIQQDLQRACSLHKRTSSDYKKCIEFSTLTSDLLARLEDAGCDKMADKIMSILLDCNPKEGGHCDNSIRVGEKIKKIIDLLNE